MGSSMDNLRFDIWFCMFISSISNYFFAFWLRRKFKSMVEVYIIMYIVFIGGTLEGKIKIVWFIFINMIIGGLVNG
jgi:hypothetical protein